MPRVETIPEQGSPPEGPMSSAAWPRAGRLAWTALGVLALAVVLALALRELALVVVPLVLALFPATLLVPVARRLEAWKLPRTLAALVTLVAGILFLVGIAVGVGTLVVANLPDVLESAGEGVQGLEAQIGELIPGFEVPALDEIQERFLDPDEGVGAVAGQLLRFTLGAVEVVAGILLLVVILFFYVRGGRGLAQRFVGFVAPRSQDRLMSMADEAWDTLGSYFRGQLLVALADAVLIGLGLLILGIPLALPLAVIVFFGGLFPIVGAVTTGILAVLVAFADAGPWTALGVAGLVLAVQQLEGNVLEPLILSQVLDLHPLTIIVAITLGAIVLGVLGAFLAVPFAAITKKLVLRLREGNGGDEPTAESG